MIVEDEQLLARILHRVLTQVLYEIRDGHGLVALVDGGHRERMPALVCKQHLQPATNTFH